MAVVINGNGNITGLDGVFSADSVNTLVDTRIDSDSFVELTGNQTVAGIKTFSDNLFVDSAASVNTLTLGARNLNSGYNHVSETGSGAMGIYGHNAIAHPTTDNVVKNTSASWHSHFVRMYYDDGIAFHTSESAIGTDNTTVWNFASQDSATSIERMRIAPNGLVVIGENQTPYNMFSVRDSDMGFEVNPNASKEVRLNAYDRGTSTFKTMALQANPVVIRPGGANGVDYTTIDADGIKFNGDTAAANALDDYEEGTWTPVLTYGGGNTGQSMSINVEGSYVKIGSLVTANIRWTQLTKGTSTGAVALSLPFAVENTLSTTALEAQGSLGYYQNVTVTHSTLTVTAWHSSSTVQFYYRASDTSTNMTSLTDAHVGDGFDGRATVTYRTT